MQFLAKKLVAPPSTLIKLNFKSSLNLNSRFLSILSSEKNKNYVSLNLDCGSKFKLLNTWLREHCKCEKCWSSQTFQRNMHPGLLPEDLKVETIETHPDHFTIKWGPDGHESVYKLDFIDQHYDPQLHANETYIAKEKSLWNAATMGRELYLVPRIDYKEVINTSQGMGALVDSLQKFGIGLVSNTPIDSPSTEKLAQALGPVRNTHYGGFWEFEADNKHNDAAYQNVALDPHTDTTYFNDPAGIQMFHMLKFDGEGGEQVYVDGFKVAHDLRKDYPYCYESLSTYPQPYHNAGDDGVLIQSGFGYPVFQHSGLPHKILRQIRYNYDSRSTLPHPRGGPGLNFLSRYYRAFKLLHTKYITDPKYQVTFQLKPGTTILLDNHRVLHGRKAFQASVRKLCGAYINFDDLVSKYNSLRRADKHKVL